MSKKYERLKCSECGCLLERRYSNEFLHKHYPVNGVKGLLKEENMRIQRKCKRLWKCPKCKNFVELSTLQFILIIIDHLRGNYII